MKHEDTYVSIVDSVFTEAIAHKILRLYAEDETRQPYTVEIEGKTLINFGSAGYLGLELDPRLRAGTIDAVTRYGTQFPFSRGYISAPLYLELEALLAKMFNAHPLISASTTLGHLATLPVIVGPHDALIIDVQAHHSMQLAASQCRLKGSPIEIIRHSRMDLLEDAIKTFRNKGAQNIWYIADGIYSMYGDCAPVDDIITLLDKYDNFYLYIDDAHGMSWTGKHGRGSVLGQRDIHPKMIVAVSLNKSFSAAGGVILFPNAELLRKVSNCGSTMVFCGPIQPPMLGAAVASAKIHLSDELLPLQQELHDKINYCTALLRENNLPLLSNDPTPIRFIGLGLMSVTCNVIKRLMQEGFYTSLATFPAVPMKRSGIRISLNRYLRKDDIKNLVQALQHHLPLALKEENYELNFLKTFGDVLPQRTVAENKVIAKQVTNEKNEFKLIYNTTIKDIDKNDWDIRLGGRGTFSWDGLRFMEDLFANQPLPENNWHFHYYTIRDNAGKIVLMTFFISALCKDDIFSPGSVSERIENVRINKNNPYYLCSKMLMMGSLFSEGNHLFIDRTSDWQGALKLLINHINGIQETTQAQTIIFRDFPADDEEMHHFMLEQGYVKLSVPDTHVFENKYENYEQVIALLPADKRKFIRKVVLKHEHLFELEILDQATGCSSAKLEEIYQLYYNVKSKNFDINTFDLPKNIFSTMLKTSVWEILVLYLKEPETQSKLAVAMVASLKMPNTYCPMVIGLDYKFVKSYGVYRQMLYQVIKRGIALRVDKVLLGMTASLQKRRFGAVPHETVAYFQTTDTYKMEVIGQMQVEKRTLVD